jgi:hypothetical protein
MKKNTDGNKERLFEMMDKIDSTFKSEQPEKYFLWTDKTGRGQKSLRIPESRIKNNWNLEDEDWTTDQKLGDFIQECYIDDVWETRTEKLKCIRIK